MYPDLCDLVCMPHSLDNVGKRLYTPLLDSFLRAPGYLSLPTAPLYPCFAISNVPHWPK